MEAKLTRGLFVPLLALGLLMGTGAHADEETPEISAETTVQFERVSLFKNGLGYFQAKVELPRGATRIDIGIGTDSGSNRGQLPTPVHGTFWVDTPESLKVRGFFTRKETRLSERTVQSGLELLQANIGQRARVVTSEGTLEGTVLSLSAPTSEDESDPDPPGRDPWALMAINPRAVQPPAVQALVFLDTGSGVVALSAGSIHQVEFPHASAGELVSSSFWQPSPTRRYAPRVVPLDNRRWLITVPATLRPSRSHRWTPTRVRRARRPATSSSTPSRTCIWLVGSP